MELQEVALVSTTDHRQRMDSNKNLTEEDYSELFLTKRKVVNSP